MYDFQSNFAVHINGFLEQRGLLGHSTAEHRKKLGSFDRFCLTNFQDESSLSREIAFAWCNDAKGNGGVQRASVIRGFGRYLAAAGEAAYVLPPSFFPHSRARLPHILSDDELCRFFAAADSYPPYRQSPLLEYTAPVIFRLQYACGMRPQEVRLLRRSDFDFGAETIYIAEGKHNKDRKLAVDAGTMEMCRKYDRVAEATVGGRTYFFPSPSGGAYRCDWLADLFHKCWDLSGNDAVCGKCTPYTFRHNFATRVLMRWIEEGRDIDVMMPYLSAYMGHSTFSSTYYYLQLLPERLAHMGFTSTGGVIPEVTP